MLLSYCTSFISIYIPILIFAHLDTNQHIGLHTRMSAYVSACAKVGRLCISLHTVLCQAVNTSPVTPSSSLSQSATPGYSASAIAYTTTSSSTTLPIYATPLPIYATPLPGRYNYCYQHESQCTLKLRFVLRSLSSLCRLYMHAYMTSCRVKPLILSYKYCYR